MGNMGGNPMGMNPMMMNPMMGMMGADGMNMFAQVSVGRCHLLLFVSAQWLDGTLSLAGNAGDGYGHGNARNDGARRPARHARHAGHGTYGADGRPTRPSRAGGRPCWRRKILQDQDLPQVSCATRCTRSFAFASMIFHTKPPLLSHNTSLAALPSAPRFADFWKVNAITDQLANMLTVKLIYVCLVAPLSDQAGLARS